MHPVLAIWPVFSCYDLCYACDCVLADKFIKVKLKLTSVVYRGENLDDILRAENERLTEDRNTLLQTITKLEQKLSALESQAGTEEQAADVVSESQELE